MEAMKLRKAFFVAQIVLWNTCACLLWWALVEENPARWKALFVLLPLQFAANFAVIGITRRMHISGLTVVLVLGLLFGLFKTVRTQEWWALIFIPLSLGLIVLSMKGHRLALSRRIEHDGSQE
jgi:hypothetical protein